ncbi:MAG: family 78 glycoside hydrolase catalytic domain [Verrucomicrobiota bacterium]
MNLRLLAASLIAIALIQSLAAEYEAVRLECELAANPLGVDVSHPKLSWQVRSEQRGQRQTAWQLLVASSPEVLAADRGDLWDSGKISGDRTTFIPYAGKPLASSQQVFWKIRSWDREGQPSAWSESASWTMGLLEPGDWKAKWITSAKREENLLTRREFTVKPGLRRALAHVTGLGQYELFLNGEKAGRDLLSPGWTDYKDTVLYDTRDVTSQLREGANAAGLALGNGMFHVVRPPGRFAKIVGSFGQQRAILQLRLEYADGSVETLGTDGTWKTHSGPITFSSIYGGEDFDARLEKLGWKESGFDDAQWTPAVVSDDKSGVLRGQSRAAEAIAPIETRTVKAKRELSPGVVLYDFGQNAPFMPRLRINGSAGSVVKLTAGEVVNEDGSIDRATMGGAHRGSAWWQYTKATDGEETWFPQFYFLGSRYLYTELMPAVEGGVRPKVESVEMVVVHSTAEPAGHFATSDPTLNRIRDLVRWAQRSNMMSILMDCPHREKLGWLEQNHLNGPALRYEWDLDRLAAKNTQDMAEAQTEEGLIPNIAPEYTVFKNTYRAAAEWGASFILVPWQQYLFTGDDSLLRGHYDAMTRYFAYLEKRANGGLLDEGLGDWYDVVLDKPGRANLTPPPITATAHFYQDAVILAKIAGVLGRAEDAKRFTETAEKIREIYNRELFKPGSLELYGTGSQASLAIPLAMGITPPEQRDAVVAALLKEIGTRGYFTTGAIGTRYLFQVLNDTGHQDLLYKFITNPEIPGYAWQLKQGNTSLAESWTAQRGASQNHFFLGQILEWFYQDLAGIAPDEAAPGFKHTLIKPQPVDGVEWVEASHESTHGPIHVRWERKEGTFFLKVKIPANTTATVWLPTRKPEAITEGGRPVADSPGVTSLSKEGDRALFQVTSGDYEFRSSW